MRKVFFLLLWKLFLLSSVFPQDIINLTEKNRLLLDQKLSELQKKEFWEYSRGRIRRKPVSINEGSLIQALFYRKDQILDEITQSFEVALKLNKEILDQYNELLPTEIINLWKRVLNKKIITNYDLSSITTAEDFIKLHNQIKIKGWELNLIPYRLKLYFHLLSDIQNLISEKEKKTILKFHQLAGEVLSLFQKDLNPTSLYELENRLSAEINSLARYEYEFVRSFKSQEKEKKEVLPEDFITFTIRTREGLIIIYGEPSAISKIKELIEGVSEVYFEQERLLNFLRSKNIPGLINIEEFYILPGEFKGERKKIVKETTLRAAILDGELPLIEGLKEEEAQFVLESLGWYVEFSKEKEEEKIEKFLDKENKVVILTGTSGSSSIFIGRIYWE